MFGGGLSDDGLRFTYTDGAQEVQVWDLTRPSSDEAPNESTLTGWSPTGEMTGIALDRKGSRRDGSLYVSSVSAGGNRNAGTVLPGAGTAPHAVAFVGDDLLISASGNAVAVWDLNRTTPGDYVTADLEAPCSACGPHDVAVSPNGKRAVITNPGYTFVDFESGTARTGSTKVTIMGAVWVDDDTFLAFAPNDGVALVVGADQQVRRQIEISRQAMTVSIEAARRPDGVVVALTGPNLISIPPTLDSATARPVDAQSLSADGRFVARAAGDPQQIEFVSTDDLGVAGVVRLAPGNELLKVGQSDGSSIPLVIADERGSL